MPDAKRDVTFDDLSLYGSTHWAAAKIGKGYSWLISHRDDLVKNHGFPRPDAVTGHYIKADVETWVSRRRQIPDRIDAVTTTTDSSAGINSNAL
jgi:hypothetical protein